MDQPVPPKPLPKRTPPTLRDAYFFFLPLILMSEMMMISHPIIHGFLARTHQPTISLAAYNAAFSFHASIGGPVWTTPLICLGFMRDRTSVRRLLSFSLRVAFVITFIECLVGLSPLGDYLYGSLMRVSAETARQAKIANVVMALVMPLVVLRHISQVMMMVHRQTIFVTLGAFVRLGSLFIWLPLTLAALHGAQVGSVAFTLSLFAECLVMACIGIPFYLQLEEKKEDPPSYREIWHFGWPLMMSQSVEAGVNLTINLFLGRLLNPDRGVAAFGVINGLMRLLLSPLRNLSQTTQALVRQRQDWPVLLRFACTVMVIFVGLVLVIFCMPSVSRLILQNIIGLPQALYAYAQPGLWMPLLITPFWVFVFFFRGLLSALRHTKPIGESAFGKLAALVLWGLVVIHAFPQMNGVVFGMAATLISFLVDSLWLGLPLLRYWNGTQKED